MRQMRKLSHELNSDLYNDILELEQISQIGSQDLSVISCFLMNITFRNISSDMVTIPEKWCCFEIREVGLYSLSSAYPEITYKVERPQTSHDIYWGCESISISTSQMMDSWNGSPHAGRWRNPTGAAVELQAFPCLRGIAHRKWYKFSLFHLYLVLQGSNSTFHR